MACDIGRGRMLNNRERSNFMSLRLDGKNALITGVASGIGRASTLRFAQEGAFRGRKPYCYSSA
jgi:hypothetical protein